MLAGTEEAGTIHDQVAVKSPGLGDQRKNLLQDIARFTGGKAVREGLELQLNNIQISDLGQAEGSSSTRTTRWSDASRGTTSARTQQHEHYCSAPWNLIC